MPSLTDWETRFRNGKSLVPVVPDLNTELADRAESLFRSFIIPDMSPAVINRYGNTMGDLGGDWFFEIVRAIFGSYDPKTGIRRIKDVFILVPKKNGKTTYMALLMLTALFMSDRRQDEFVLVAPTLKVADLAFSIAAGALRAQPDRFHNQCVDVADYKRQITRLHTGATLLVKAASKKAVTGGRQTGTLIDETHVFADIPHSEGIFTELRGARASRPDGFTVQITTMPKTEPRGLFLAEYERAKAVRDDLPSISQKVKDSTLPVMYMWPEKERTNEEWRQREKWPLVNPNWGRSLEPDFLEEGYEAAQHGGDDDLRLFVSQHLNVEIDAVLGEGRWAAADQWHTAKADFPLTLDSLLERSEICAVGIDVGGLDDFLSLAVLGREKESWRWLHWGLSWVDCQVFKRRPKLKSLTKPFIKEDSLRILQDADPGRGRRELCELVRKVEDSGKLPIHETIGMDRIGDKLLPDMMIRSGINRKRMVGVKQAGYQHGIIHTIEHKLRDKSLVHGNTHLMRWCLGNVHIVWRVNSVAITKEHAAEKIDPVAAMVNAADRMAALADTSKPEYNLIGVDFKI